MLTCAQVPESFRITHHYISPQTDDGPVGYDLHVLIDLQRRTHIILHMDLQKVYKLSPLPRALIGSGRGQNYDRKKKSGIKRWLTLTVVAFAVSSIPKASADTKYCSKVNTGDGDGSMFLLH